MTNMRNTRFFHPLVFPPRRGFSVVEAILASSIFALFVTAFVGVIIYGQESSALAGARERAGFLAAEGVEELRNKRDAAFTNLVDGTVTTTHGGTSTSETFTRTVTTSTVDVNTKRIVSTVTWQQNAQRQGSVSVESRLANWRVATSQQANSAVFNTSNAVIGGSGKSELRGITLQNTSGTDAITIDKVTVSWSDLNQNMRSVTMNGSLVWSNNGPGSPQSNQVSGAVTDIVNVSISARQTITLNAFAFTGNMNGNTFTIVFTFADGSTKSITVTPT